MLKPIDIRRNHMRSQEPFRKGFLLPDRRHAMYCQDGVVSLLPVVPFTHGLWAQDGESHIVAYVAFKRDEPDDTLITALYARLNRITAFELLTKYHDEEADAYLILREPQDDEDFEEIPWDEFGRNIPRE